MTRTASRPFDVGAFLGARPRRRLPANGRVLGRRNPAGDRGPRQGRRTYLLLPKAEARCLILAFRRFVELHGRALTWPPDACALDAVTCPSGETVMLALWSRHAAVEFDRFWSRYRLFYGPETSCLALNGFTALLR